MIGHAPDFWSRPESLLARLLSPIGHMAGAVTLRRMARPGAQVGIPVICVGNPTVGGAGKTPTAIALLERLKARGARPFALLRGHGGKARTPLLVDPARHDAALVGDEALLLAGHAPTIVAGSDRLGGARQAQALGATHVVMDDGFQNPSLHKDATVLVVDGGAGIGNGFVLPAGPLRAPLAPQLALADLLLVIGEGSAGEKVADTARDLGIATAHGRLLPDETALAALRARRVLAFAGIGRPEKFFATLVAGGVEMARAVPFADHHPYAPQEIGALAEAAAREGLALVTTEKDLARMSGPAFAGVRAGIAALPVALKVEEAGGADAPDALDGLIDQAERAAATRPSGSASVRV